ncbi:recombinase family protein [Sphingomonas sabuli]|uniref:Recombinase family protein n=1 Tax=Sphingomonas sabuli TaxID=2764186 RepID=A0A7G9L1U8_9SPHN|nr:recombinase family protein [Sphingomonas sabuli]QNM82597.1 recombinase family protein [Sphingomonas sabuli]
MMPTTVDLQQKRCAIYTRRSVEQGLDHQFSSLEAQRAICSAYVASQQPKGWTEIPKHYDDGGQSGGNLNRPALQDLLSDVESGVVDVVVIYKLDRISRTLLDFVRLMDLFESFGVAFVAVTQNFDTADSTGRLILNVLLTFAQFEREISSDRLRDKFTAMRQRGLFVGGNPPFGYDLVDKKLVVNEPEAEVIRWMFRRYLEAKSYVTVSRELARRGVLRRSRVSKRGNFVRGRGISASSVWNMLGNPLYAGQVRNKGNCYPGIHDAIIPEDLWEDVQALRAKRTRAKVVEIYKTDLLRDLIYDGFGRKMGVFRDRRYREVRRYYISNQSEWGRRHGARRYRVKADPLEQLVLGSITSLLSNREQVRGLLLETGNHDGKLNKLCGAGDRIAKALESATPKRAQCILKALIERIELSSSWVKIIVRLSELPRLLQWDGIGLFRGDTIAWERSHQTTVIEIPANAVSMKRELTLLLKRRSAESAQLPNKHLVAMLDKARVAQAALDDRNVYTVTDLAMKVHCHPKRFTQLARLNYLAPDIVAAIRDGSQPAGLTCRTLYSVELPMDWALQRRILGFPDQPDFLRAAPGW